MSSFDDRADAFENKFAHDADLQFKAEARRNKLLGLWAADLMGKSPEAAELYAQEIVAVALKDAGTRDLRDKLASDLGGKADAALIDAQMTALLDTAKAQIMQDV